LPPERMSPFIAGQTLVDVAQLAVVPAHGPGRDEGEADALLRLPRDHGADVIVEVAGVAREQLEPELLHLCRITLQLHVSFEHAPTQLVVLDAGLDAERR